MRQPSAEALKSELASGSGSAYATLYDLLGPALLRTARTMLRSSGEAEDAVQDLFVALARSRDRIAEAEDLTAYVFAALRHTVLRRLERASAEKRRLAELARLPRQPAGRAGEWDLEAAVQRLPSEQREVIAMKIDGGLTFMQIGQVLGISPNTAASRYRYALEKLRELLKE